MALYHTTKGSVDYTVVGSPTIVDGVVSGFNGYPNPACLSLPETADFSKPFHIHIEFTPTVTNFGVIIGRTGSLKSGVYLQGIYSDYCRFALYNSSSTPAILDQNIAYDSAVVTGNKHALDIIYNGTDTYSIKLKNMISSVVLVNSSITTEAGAGSNAGFTLGATKSDTYYVPFQGSIDLNETYIKVNGQPWFGLCPVEVKKHQLMGPVGYTKVGSPTIVDGVASGFSASDYLKINNNFSSSSNFEIVVRGTAIYAAAQRACLAFNNGENGFLDIGSGSSGIRLALKYNGSLTSFRIYPNLIEGQLYYIHIIKTNSTLTLGYSTDGKNILLSEDFSLTSFDWIFSYILLGMVPWQSATSYGGSIDLNQTYIKVNGKLWFWQPQKSKYIVKDGKLVFADPGLYLTGPVNYEVVGSPAIVDGVASGFSADDYTKTSSSIDVNYNIVNGFDLQTRIKIPSYSSGLAIHYFTGSGGISSGLSINSAGKVYWLIGRDDTSETNISIGGGTTTTIPLDTYYYIRLKISNKIATLYTSIDGALWNTESTLDMTEMVIKTYYNRPFGFGHAGISTNNNYIFNGSIDLNNTYIKVNDQLWFYGKNYATQNIAPVPSGYTFGTTTTPSIGYVDMRTQVFTAAPAGATVGRDL